ncbi:MAG: sigma-54-dependent Fis family transcriptional regulator, partial [Bryobacterales bacterium]|nr:sigma-54-dependent Fis family transcriptional regulator [Bryobacterales bacterium]
LNVIEVQIPPLRERREDIPLLARHFVDRLAREIGKEVNGLTEGAMKALLDHNWPGNVRELENAIERAIVTSRTGTITEDDLMFLAGNGGVKATQLPDVPLADLEKLAIEAVLRRTSGNVKEAAQRLGIDRSTLYEKIKKYELAR